MKFLCRVFLPLGVVVSLRIAVVVFLPACHSAAAEGQRNEPIHALILASSSFKLDAEVEKRLLREGIQVVTKDMTEPLSAEMLKLFHVVILLVSGDLGGFQTPIFVPHEFVVKYLNGKRNIAELHRYVAAGGGLFVSVAMTGAGLETAEGCEPLLEPRGIRLLAAQVRDEAHSCCNGEYAWTTNIAKSPVTAGVQRIVYPTNQLRWDDAYATVPFVPENKEWQPLVRGLPKSVAAKGLQYTTWLPMEGQKSPVLAAIRPVEKGRVGVLGVAPFYTLQMPFAKPPNGWVGESHTGLIDGIFLEKGDGNAPSDGWRLLVNMFRWLAESSRVAGFGGYTKERLAQTPAPATATIPSWLSGWREETGAQPFKVLIGARSSFSDGKGTVAELAEAARKVGYSILVMTETFERFDPKSWEAFLAECKKASGDEFVVMPGLDIPDVYQNRYLLFGQRVFPDRFMLSDDGKALKETQFLSLGFGTHCVAVHRPTTTPMVHQLYKHFSGVVVYTYREGKLIDDGTLAYQWQVNNGSQPLPLAVHEIYSPKEIELASTGHQLFVFADAVQNAAWYLRAGIQHFWESPALFLVSSGPMIRTLTCGSPVEKSSDVPVHTRGTITVESDAPITDVQLINHYYPERRWRPKEKRVSLEYHLPPSHLRWCFVYAQDEKGRAAISSPLRFGPTARYTWRCADRQNFFGYAMSYTGTYLPDVDFVVPTFGTDEGRGVWAHQMGPRRGENLAPLLEFSYASPAVYITDAVVDQRYWRALWEEVVFDAKPSQGTSRSRVFEARVRYYDFNLSEAYREKDTRRPMMLKEITLRLRAPVVPTPPVFPIFTKVSPQPEYGYFDAVSGKEVKGKLERGFIDLPAGGYADDLIALAPGIRVSTNGDVGFAAPEWSNGPLPVGTSWTARYVKVPKEQLQELRAVMGVGGKTPYELKLSRGKVQGVAYAAHLQAEGFGVAGTIASAPKMPYALPLFIEGVNGNWEAAVWREDGALDSFGVFEGKGLARLDGTKGGKFYAGNVIVADNPNLRLTILRWDAKGIAVEANNPTEVDVEAIIETPQDIVGRYRLRETVKVPAGSSVRLEFGASNQS